MPTSRRLCFRQYKQPQYSLQIVLYGTEQVVLQRMSLAQETQAIVAEILFTQLHFENPIVEIFPMGGGKFPLTRFLWEANGGCTQASGETLQFLKMITTGIIPKK